ncbi:MAG: SelB C-terminal domain-containing protein, partial [Candidatus Baltobacteraceae bacterium]
VLGTLVVDELPTVAEEVRAQLHLRAPVVAFPGARFIVRRPTPKTLLGGGYVDVVEARAGAGGTSETEQAVLAVLRERSLLALDTVALAAAANMREVIALGALERLAASGDVIALTRPPAYVDAIAAHELLARALAYLEAAHSREPWAMGVTSIALSRALEAPEALLIRLLAAFVEDGRLTNRNGYYATLDHRPTLTGDQRTLFESFVPLDNGRPFLPAPFAAVADGVKHAQVAGAAKAFDTMLAGGALVKIGDELYRGSQIASIRARVESHLRAHERMTAAEFRDLLGTSRKYAVPLLEWLDARGVTIRNGDYRTLRKRSPA